MLAMGENVRQYNVMVEISETFGYQAFSIVRRGTRRGMPTWADRAKARHQERSMGTQHIGLKERRDGTTTLLPHSAVSNATHPDNKSAFFVLREMLEHFDYSSAERVVASLADHFGSIAALFKASAEEIVFRSGAPVEIAELVASFGRLHHAALGEEIGDRPAITSFDALQQFVMHRLRGGATEELIVILLDRQSCLIREHPIRSGSIDHVALYPREVARLALLYGASAVILAHNHPSGDPTPSRQDIELTRTVADALACLGIALHEHIIVGHNRVAGLRSMGLI